MAPLRSLVDRHPIATFFAASVGLGWLLSAYALVSADPLVVPLVAMAVSFVPAGAAWLVLRASGTAAERQAWRARLTRVRVGWRWYAVALFALPLTYLAGIGIATVVGGTVPFHPQASGGTSRRSVPYSTPNSARAARTFTRIRSRT